MADSDLITAEEDGDDFLTGPYPWDKLPRETPQQYRLFRIFLSLGYTRTPAQAADKYREDAKPGASMNGDNAHLGKRGRVREHGTHGKLMPIAPGDVPDLRHNICHSSQQACRILAREFEWIDRAALYDAWTIKKSMDNAVGLTATGIMTMLDRSVKQIVSGVCDPTTNGQALDSLERMAAMIPPDLIAKIIERAMLPTQNVIDVKPAVPALPPPEPKQVVDEGAGI